MSMHGPCAKMTLIAISSLVVFHIGHGQFMQNALNTVGPVEQAKRSVLHRLVSHRGKAEKMRLCLQGGENTVDNSALLGSKA